MMRRLGFRHTWVEVCFLASVGAAAVHLAAARPHLEEWAPAGGFMLASGIAQLAWALWVARSPRELAVAAGVGLNTGLVMTWLVSRTTGLPFGPSAGIPEHVHAADALATTLEVILVASALAISSESRPRRWMPVLAGVGAAVAVVSGGHDRVREGLTAAVVLNLAVVARWFVCHFEARREHVIASLIGRVRGLVGAPRRPGLGARGEHPRPRHRHLEQPGV